MRGARHYLLCRRVAGRHGMFCRFFRLAIDAELLSAAPLTQFYRICHASASAPTASRLAIFDGRHDRLGCGRARGGSRDYAYADCCLRFSADCLEPEISMRSDNAVTAHRRVLACAPLRGRYAGIAQRQRTLPLSGLADGFSATPRAPAEMAFCVTCVAASPLPLFMPMIRDTSRPAFQEGRWRLI